MYYNDTFPLGGDFQVPGSSALERRDDADKATSVKAKDLVFKVFKIKAKDITGQPRGASRPRPHLQELPTLLH